MASRRVGLFLLSVLIACIAPRVHAQALPPAATPADPFHQPCVAVRASPEASMPGGRGTRRGLAVPRRVVKTPAAGRVVRKEYVDLDNRCATPPAFAPMRDVDSTSIWHVDAPAGDMHATAKPSATRALHGRTS
ncbi:hypothetical protein [Pandoraea terrigena]|uniref:Lipoprotein n=1 Tax=Pandoraea terrigena TaxID=2508292 RepID=A0A5E4UHL1_9BURK|nr:hypothetical protein [Pandoraea terrigena]VVD99536.1 hypothetical protein PTE31013_02058 [Pandoraea terrigena]